MNVLHDNVSETNESFLLLKLTSIDCTKNTLYVRTRTLNLRMLNMQLGIFIKVYWIIPWVTDKTGILFHPSHIVILQDVNLLIILKYAVFA